MTIARPSHLVAGVGALFFAFLVLASGFDRMSEQRPSFARFVPPAFAAASSSRKAADALASRRNGLAERHARAAIRRDPLDARSLGFLGAAQLEQGAALPAHMAFRQADALSRREPLSQLYFFAQELAIGADDRAAKRLDSFLRSVNGREVAQTMLAMFEERAGNSAQFVGMLVRNPKWAEAYLRADGAGSERLRSRANFLARPDRALDEVGCEPVLPMVTELASLNFRKEAEAVLRRHCPGDVPRGPLADPEFARFSDEAAPLGWRRYRSGDVRISQLAGDEARVELENRSSVTRLMLSQPVALGPGAYLVRAKVDGPGGQDLSVSLDCSKPSRPRARRERIDREGQRVIAPACPDAVLSLWLRPRSGRVVIDRVELLPVNR